MGNEENLKRQSANLFAGISLPDTDETEESGDVSADDLRALQAESKSLQRKIASDERRKLHQISRNLGDKNPELRNVLINKIMKEGPDSVSDNYLNNLTTKVSDVDDDEESIDNTQGDIEATVILDDDDVDDVETTEAPSTESESESEAENAEDDVSLEELSMGLMGELDKEKQKKVETLTKLLKGKNDSLLTSLLAKIDAKGHEVINDRYLDQLRSQYAVKHDDGEAAKKAMEEKAQAKADEGKKKKGREGVSKDAKVIIDLEDDAMTAKATLHPAKGGGLILQAEDIYKAIEAKGITFGLIEEKFQSMVAKLQTDKQPIEDIVIAKGVYPEEGRTGELEIVADFRINPLVREMSIKEMLRKGIPQTENYHYAFVQKGDLLLRMHSSIPGKAGMNVLGEEVPCGEIRKLVFTHKGNVEPKKQEGEVVEYYSRIEGKAYFFKNYVEVRPHKDAIFEVTIPNDKITAFVDINPPYGDGAFMTKKSLLARCKELGIIHGVLEGEIRDIIAFHQEGERIRNALVAQGKPAEHGANAVFELHAKRASEAPETKERVSYKDIAGNLISVTEGQHLATYTPAQEKGEDGMDVYGQVIPSQPGKEIKITLERNIRVEKDPATGVVQFYSEIAGQLLVNEDEEDVRLLSVSPVYVVAKDVDMHVGNIKFNGDIEIGGNIQDGFSVEADGTIVVKGNIGKSKITATQNIIVGKGIITREQGFVKAGGDIQAKFIEHSKVEAGGDVMVERAILNSDIMAKRRVQVLGDRASIIGGVVKATEGIETLNIGSTSGVKTEVHVGLDFEMQQKVQEMYRERKKYSRYQQDLENLVNRIEKNAPDVEQLNEEMKRIYSEGLKKLNLIRKHVNTLKMQEAEMLTEMDSAGDAEIIVQNVLYSDVRVSIGRYQMDIQKQKSAVILFFNDENARIGYRQYIE